MHEYSYVILVDAQHLPHVSTEQPLICVQRGNFTAADIAEHAGASAADQAIAYATARVDDLAGAYPQHRVLVFAGPHGWAGDAGDPISDQLVPATT